MQACTNALVIMQKHFLMINSRQLLYIVELILAYK